MFYYSTEILTQYQLNLMLDDANTGWLSTKCICIQSTYSCLLINSCLFWRALFCNPVGVTSKIQIYDRKTFSRHFVLNNRIAVSVNCACVTARHTIGRIEMLNQWFHSIAWLLEGKADKLYNWLFGWDFFFWFLPGFAFNKCPYCLLDNHFVYWQWALINWLFSN